MAGRETRALIVEATSCGRVLAFGFEEQNIMKVRAIYASFAVGMFAVASCTVSVDDESASNDLGEERAPGQIEEPIRKGSPGAVNGAIDYCNNPASTCASGEGDCDSDAQCAAGLICALNNGLKFGFPKAWDVCVPSHCSDGLQNSGETGIDCGGACGACTACVGTPGDRNFCVGCQCASGQGDCDSSAECAPGLTCGTNNGSKFALPSSFDICVPAHCTNRVLDAASGETGVDVGGPCGTLCGNGVVDSGEACDDGINDGVFCSADCSTATVLGQILVDCDGNASVLGTLTGTDCIPLGFGASYITFATSGVQVTLYSNGDCTGNTKTVSSDINFCADSFDQGGSLNDAVFSAKASR
jgi:hypothetical protein